MSLIEIYLPLPSHKFLFGKPIKTAIEIETCCVICRVKYPYISDFNAVLMKPLNHSVM